ncbi:MAG: hypothetical protein AAFY60_03145 [Myxococcota bacterium]
MGYFGFLFPKMKIRAKLVELAQDKVLQRARGLHGFHEAQLKQKLAGIVADEIGNHASLVIPSALSAFTDQLVEQASQDMCEQLWSRVELSHPV